MPSVAFTRNLQRHVACPPCVVAGGTVRESLESAFARYPKLRGYVLDEHGALRFHMAVYVNGVPIADRQGLSDPVPPTGEIFVMQALSGG
ncbi:MAG: MoaD/ThiS family protein [Acidobacteria bacterium]|nr:MoaD/ThiS family protein [Acidobacteriota bacterium]MBI3487681.1 MoaD/ThiS family protein [Acidobacteriota bacterium]